VENPVVEIPRVVKKIARKNVRTMIAGDHACSGMRRNRGNTLSPVKSSTIVLVDALCKYFLIREIRYVASPK